LKLFVVDMVTQSGEHIRNLLQSLKYCTPKPFIC